MASYLLVGTPGGYSNVYGLHLSFLNHRRLTWKQHLMACLHSYESPAGFIWSFIEIWQFTYCITKRFQQP